MQTLKVEAPTMHDDDTTLPETLLMTRLQVDQRVGVESTKAGSDIEPNHAIVSLHLPERSEHVALVPG
jgi:hypothetical protein